MTFLPDFSNDPLGLRESPGFERLTAQITSHQYQRWELRHDRVQLQVMHSYSLHPLETIEIPFTTWHLEMRLVSFAAAEWKQCILINAVLPRERAAIGQERIAIDGVLLFGTWLDFRVNGDTAQITLRLEPTALSETRVVDAFGQCFLYVGAIVQPSDRALNEPLFPSICHGCRNFHGQTYGGNPFCCAIHPDGKDDCEDFLPHYPNRLI